MAGRLGDVSCATAGSVVFSCCILLFQLANAATLPLMAGILTVGLGSRAAMVIAAGGGRSTTRRRRHVALGGSPIAGAMGTPAAAAALLRRLGCPLRIVCTCLQIRILLSPVQMLDGVSAAVLAVMFPLVVADITRETGRFSLALGIVGGAVGIGAALSTTLAGFMHDHLGAAVTFCSLARHRHPRFRVGLVC